MKINTGLTLKHELTWPKATRLKTIRSNKYDTLWTHHLFHKTYYFSNSHANLCLRNSAWESWPEGDSVRSCSKNDWWSSHQSSWYGWARASYYFRRNITTGIIQRGRLLWQWLLLWLGAACMNTISRPTEASPGSCVSTSIRFSGVYGSWWLAPTDTKTSLQKIIDYIKICTISWMLKYKKGFWTWRSWLDDDWE